MRAKFKGATIEINLPKGSKRNGYLVECTYKYDKKVEKYLLSMWLKRNDINNKFQIRSQEIDTQYITGTKETIVDNICRVVEQMCIHNFFNEYIDRYEYELSCFERGDEIICKEKLKNDSKE